MKCGRYLAEDLRSCLKIAQAFGVQPPAEVGSVSFIIQGFFRAVKWYIDGSFFTSQPHPCIMDRTDRQALKEEQDR